MAFNENPDYAKLGDVAALTRAFSAYLSAPTGNITGDGTLVLVPYDATLYNDGQFDPLTSIYTANAKGIYFFTHTVAFNGGDASTDSYISCWDGNAFGSRAFQLTPVPAVPNTIIFSASIIIPMEIGDGMKITALAGGLSKNVLIYGSAPTSVAVASTFSGGCMKLLT